MLRLRATGPNLLLAAGVSLLMAAILEGVGRVWEGVAPPPATAAYLWRWQERWDGEFYTVDGGSAGWPPGSEFNADGLRDRPHPEEKTPGVWRVVFLGDSVTLGAGVKADEAFPQLVASRAEAEGRALEALNIALWGWSTRQERLAWERIGRRYRPDQVVLAVCLNDLAELQNNLARPPAWLSLLHRRSALVRQLVGAHRREIQQVEQLFSDPDSARVEQAYERFFDEVRWLRRDVLGAGARFAMIVFPFRFQVLPGAPPPLAQQRILEFCRAEGMICRDMLPDLQPLGAAAFVDYDHLSPAGTTRTAEVLVETGLVPHPRSAEELLAGSDPVLALDHGEASVRAAAAWRLGRPPDEDAVPLLAEKLARDPAPRVRLEAARALGRFGPPARAALPDLVAALRDEHQAVRWAAAEALDALGPDPEAQPELVDLLTSPDPYVRGFAAHALARLGPRGPDAVVALVDALRNEGGRDAGSAAQAVGAVPAAVDEAVVAFTRELADGDARRRGRAALALGKLGPRAAPAVPALVERLDDPDGEVRVEAAVALGRIGPPAGPAVRPLAAALSSPSGGLRVAAARALGKIGPDAAPAVPELLRALDDREPELRALAARALGQIGPAARHAVPRLERAGRDGDGEVARQAQKALKRLSRGY